jgi:hypothetical protein
VSPRAGRIKGSAFREFLRWYGETHGITSVEQALAGLPPETRALLSAHKDGFGILPSTWYPAPVVHAILETFLAGRTTRERAELARAGARATMERTLRGVYGVLFAALATPERYVRFGQRLWDAYYDCGTVVMDLPAPGRLRSRIFDWPGHHRIISDMNQHAGAVIIEAMGLTVTGTARAECVSTGGTECRLETSWVVPSS